MNLRRQIQTLGYQITVNELKLLVREGGEGPSHRDVMYLDLICYQSEAGECTVSSIAKQLSISKPAVTMRVNELIAMGMVEKEQSTRDGRVYLLRLSEEALRELAAYDTPFERAIAQIEQQCTPQQIENFCEMLQIFSQKLMEESPHAGPTHL